MAKPRDDDRPESGTDAAAPDASGTAGCGPDAVGTADPGMGEARQEQGSSPADEARRALRAARERRQEQPPVQPSAALTQEPPARPRGRAVGEPAPKSSEQPADRSPEGSATRPADVARAALRRASNPLPAAATPADPQAAEAEPAAPVPTSAPTAGSDEPPVPHLPAAQAGQAGQAGPDEPAGSAAARPGDAAREALRAARAQARQASVEAGERAAHETPRSGLRARSRPATERRPSRTPRDQVAGERARAVRELLADAFRMPSDGPDDPDLEGVVRPGEEGAAGQDPEGFAGADAAGPGRPDAGALPRPGVEEFALPDADGVARPGGAEVARPHSDSPVGPDADTSADPAAARPAHPDPARPAHPGPWDGTATSSSLRPSDGTATSAPSRPAEGNPASPATDAEVVSSRPADADASSMAPRAGATPPAAQPPASWAAAPEPPPARTAPEPPPARTAPEPPPARAATEGAPGRAAAESPRAPRSMAAPSRDGEHRRTFVAFPPRSGGSFAETWWGNAWVAALEQGALDVKRLTRGRGYAEQGNVDAITVTPGLVLAYVQGSRPRPYRVQVRLRTLGDDDWERFLDAAVERPGHIAALLDKEMPESLADCGVPLLPGPGDLEPHCSCPDRGHPCKHAAALCYQTARLLDADPFVLLLLRGRGERELLDALSRRNAARAARAAQAQQPEPLPGVRAAQALAERRLPPLPAPSPVPAHPEQPPAYPSAPNGPDSFALDHLATDAAARAHALLVTGHDEIGGLTLWQDAVRLAASRPGSGLTAATRSLYASLASAAGRTPSELARAVAAWRQGGPDGLAVLEESWDPPAGRFDRARPLLLAADLPAFRPRRNHLTHPRGHVQLRYGRDGLWYAYESEPGHDDWWPRGTPDIDPVGALTGLGGSEEP